MSFSIATKQRRSDTPEERALHGISEGLVRLSIGLEGVDDVIYDLEQALPKSPIRTAA